MSKNIRVAWDDLQPGDKVHLKGTSNVYPFMAWPKEVIDADKHAVAVVDVPATHQTCFLGRETFAYATRPAPKKPKLHQPKAYGEYWINTPVLGWLQMLYTENLFPHGNLGDLTVPQHGVYTVYGHKTYQTNMFSRMRLLFNPTEIVTAEEYYTRKAKGEL